MDIIAETKEESGFLDCSSQSERDSTKDHLKKVKSETVTSGSYCFIDIKTEIEEEVMVSNYCSENDREFVSEDSVMVYNNVTKDSVFEPKVEIKEEQCPIETTEIPCIYDEIKHGTDKECFTTSPRLYVEAVSGDNHVRSAFPSIEVPGRKTGFYNGNDYHAYESQDSDVMEIPTVEEYILPEQPGKTSDGEMYCKNLHLKLKNYKDQSSPKCSICWKSFNFMSDIKHHEIIHGEKISHICDTCHKTFAKVLKVHNLSNDVQKPHQCKICSKGFIRLSDLKRHNFIHEDKKPYLCQICGKNFTQLSNLKVHNLIHENKKPHQCKICDRTFTHLSGLKYHILNHEGKKPHQCKICNKSFIRLSHLKVHNMYHEGNKVHQCEICDKSFILVSDLKRHALLHEGKKPHQCKTCYKSFTWQSSLKKHIMIHEGKKPYQCVICDKKFTQSSNLKKHILIHEGKKPHKCETCGKSFAWLSKLKNHSLVHR